MGVRIVGVGGWKVVNGRDDGRVCGTAMLEGGRGRSEVAGVSSLVKVASRVGGAVVVSWVG